MPHGCLLHTQTVPSLAYGCHSAVSATAAQRHNACTAVTTATRHATMAARRVVCSRSMRNGSQCHAAISALRGGAVLTEAALAQRAHMCRAPSPPHRHKQNTDSCWPLHVRGRGMRSNHPPQAQDSATSSFNQNCWVAATDCSNSNTLHLPVFFLDRTTPPVLQISSNSGRAEAAAVAAATCRPWQHTCVQLGSQQQTTSSAHDWAPHTPTHLQCMVLLTAAAAPAPAAGAAVAA